MESISAADLATEILHACLTDGTWPARALEALVERALDEDEPVVARNATRALFTVLIENLADLFEPSLCDVYARLFSYVIARALPEYDAAALLRRYRNIRQPRRFLGGQVDRVYVLSRVTLGADVAVTSVLMDAAKHRFPGAQIQFIGPEKNAELFAVDPDVTPIPVSYGRSALLRDRLSAAVELQTILDESGSIVIDPDSRLTQLGLIPICDDSRYYFFESRGFGGNGPATLADLAAQWAADVFDVERAHPYLAPVRQPRIADVTVSFGVGDNPNKRMDEDFEFAVLQRLLQRKRPVLLDRGAGGEEAARVNALCERLQQPELLQLHDGPYASFASHIMQSNLYVGYDSAGQHVASAAGVPLVSVFAGYACERMFQRWCPSGPQARVIRVTDVNRHSVLAETLAAISQAEGAVEKALTTGRT